MINADSFLLVVFIFFFGTIVGSFLNVVALRYNTGESVRGRSHCTSCRTELRWFELVPLVSFLILRGRCRSCGSRLAWQYPLVEALTGGLFVLLALHTPSFIAFLYLAVLFSLYIVTGIYDMRHGIVPNGLSYTAAGLAFLHLFLSFSPLGVQVPALSVILAGPIMAAPLFLLWLVSRGKWMGLGDAKLALSLGWLLGLSGGMAALLLAFWAGAFFGIALVLFHRYQRWCLRRSAGTSGLPLSTQNLTMKSEIPFAPFLLLGFFLAFFLNLSITQLLLWPLT